MTRIKWFNFGRYILGNIIVVFVVTNIARHAGMDMLSALCMGLMMTVGLNNMDALREFGKEAK